MPYVLLLTLCWINSRGVGCCIGIIWRRYFFIPRERLKKRQFKLTTSRRRRLTLNTFVYIYLYTLRKSKDSQCINITAINSDVFYIFSLSVVCIFYFAH